MSKYRFKTEEEFKKEKLWYKDHPQGWNMGGNMNKYLGQDVPEEFNSDCDNKITISYDGWAFSSQDYVLKESSFILPEAWCIKVERNSEPKEVRKWRGCDWKDGGYINRSGAWFSIPHSGYTEITFEQFKQYVLTSSDDAKIVPEKENYVGRTIRALVKSPQGTRVQIGETICIIELRHSSYKLGMNYEGTSGMLIDYPLNLNQWELVSLPEIQKESIPEYVECIRSGSEVITVGKIYNWPDPIDDKGYKRSITTLDGLVWGFKPSTKEAYEAQFAPKKLTIEEWCDLNVMPENAYPSIKKEKFIDDVQSVNVTLRTKKKTIKF
jgi:hypothetical protein